MDDCVICLGVRGSLPICRTDSIRYGGSTTCVLVRLAGELLIIDAGSGLASLRAYLLPTDLSAALVLTHTHVDHVIGLPSMLLLCKKGLELTVYGKTRSGKTVRGQLDTLLAPPLWPVGMDVIAPNAVYRELTDDFTVGNVRIETVDGAHPGGISVLKLSGGGKRVVMMTDCTVNDENRATMAAFAKGCDLLLIDGQYSEEEWCGCEAFGHNTYRAAAAFGVSCGAKRVRIVHHAPFRTDREIDEAAAQVGCRFAEEGEVIGL